MSDDESKPESEAVPKAAQAGVAPESPAQEGIAQPTTGPTKPKSKEWLVWAALADMVAALIGGFVLVGISPDEHFAAVPAAWIVVTGLLLILFIAIGASGESGNGRLSLVILGIVVVIGTIVLAIIAFYAAAFMGYGHTVEG